MSDSAEVRVQLGGILGLVAGIAAQRTLQNVFAGLQLAITQPMALGDVVEVENV